MAGPYGGNKSKGFAQYATLTAAQALTAAPTTGVAYPDGATRALIQADTQAVRWRDDGSAPTAAIGMLLPTGLPYEFKGDLSKFQFIEVVAGGKLNVAYYAY